MSLGTMCRTSGTLKRRNLSKDASGGMLMVPTTVGPVTTPGYVVVAGYENIPCDIQPATGSTRLQYMQEQMNVTHTVYTEEEIPAKAGDLWMTGIGSDGDETDARRFQVQGREMPPPGYEEWPAQMHVLEQLG